MPRPPPSHRLFSHLKYVFSNSSGDGQVLGEREMDVPEPEEEESLPVAKKKEDVSSWLEEDDIEDF
jgi:hypothetical protein